MIIGSTTGAGNKLLLTRTVLRFNSANANQNPHFLGGPSIVDEMDMKSGVLRVGVWVIPEFTKQYLFE